MSTPTESIIDQIETDGGPSEANELATKLNQKLKELVPRAAAVLEQCRRFEKRTEPGAEPRRIQVATYSNSLENAQDDLMKALVMSDVELLTLGEDGIRRLETEIAAAEMALSNRIIPITSGVRSLITNGSANVGRGVGRLGRGVSRLGRGAIDGITSSTRSIADLSKTIRDLTIAALLVAGGLVAFDQIYIDDDRDGMTNGTDACPTVPGPRSNDGCPEETLTDAPQSLGEKFANKWRDGFRIKLGGNNDELISIDPLGQPYAEESTKSE